MKLLIDVFGSDCPEALIAGCARCSLEVPEATLLLPGREDVLRPALEALPQVDAATVSDKEGTAVVTLNRAVDDAALKKAVEDEDYQVLSIQ